MLYLLLQLFLTSAIYSIFLCFLNLNCLFFYFTYNENELIYFTYDAKVVFLFKKISKKKEESF